MTWSMAWRRIGSDSRGVTCLISMPRRLEMRSTLLMIPTWFVAAQVYYGIGGSLEVEVIGSGRKTLSPLRKIKPAFPRHRSCLLDTIQQTR